MQSNNLIQVFSQAKNNYYNDTEIATSGVQTIVSMGAVSGQYSNSALYNSFCLSMSLPVVALVDYIAQQNPSVTFGMALGIDQWISAVQGTFANYTDTQNSINAINTNIANITNGTTTVGNASNVTTNINGKAISTIFESDGTTVKNATNATTVQNVNFSSSTPSQFGNYIITKKQLVFNDSNGSSNIVTSSYNINTGDILELEVGNNEISDREQIVTRASVHYRITVNTNLFFSSSKAYQTQNVPVIIYNYTNSNFDILKLNLEYFANNITNISSDSNIFVYKIYKIIE